ncbi:MFS transporter [Deinococcus maricopensis]|uniref:Major facilitator superfamily MFS_1 n=1 Tax=Deinococcus maricopensis (strain DSM 21211 / LMG 22137 / NRRL B-23946 / LB-34) TaxID=709986 RepID=E8U7N5_DEIML|nr:MFS transporter [Deinococcus maricopensis]ADV67074.1 major facilitator superfamily MFS_1 [Deinococcus maricopensis DSM 21211]
MTFSPALPSRSPAPLALGALALATLLSSLGTSSATMALPALSRAFGAPFAHVQWVVLAYLLAVTALVVVAGRVADRVGRRFSFLVGVAGFTAASGLCGASGTLGALIVSRAAQGVGAAIMTALTLALVSEVVPAARTGRAMGLLGTMSAVGTALGPALGGALIAAAGWRAVFLVNVPLGLLTLLLAFRFLPRSAGGQPGRAAPDVLGAAVLAATLAAYALAVTTGTPLGVKVGLLFAAGVGVGVFVRVEARAPAPLVPLALFRSGSLSAGVLMSALVTTVLMATLVVGPFYLSGALALDAARAGLVLSCGPITAALMGLPAGRTVERLGAARASRRGLLGVLGGCVLLALPMNLGVVGYAAPLVLLTAGYALFQVGNNTAVMTGVPAAQRGVTSGVLNLARNLGLMTGAAVMGAVFAWASAGGATAGQVAQGLRVTFGVAAGLALVALGVAVLSGGGAARAAAAEGASAAKRPRR